jgi:hypothetical protein
MLPLIADVTDKPKSHSISNNNTPVGTDYRHAELVGYFFLKR